MHLRRIEPVAIEDQVRDAAVMHGVRSVKLYGERNSGTNYLQQLVAANLHVRQLRGTTPDWVDAPFLGAEWSRDLYFRCSFASNFGWKHMQVPEQLPAAPDTLFVCLTKNPYSWLLSMFRRPHHAKQRYASFDEFLSTPWQTLGRERSVPRFDSPMAMWNAKNAAYLRLHQTHGAVLLAYEALLHDPLATLDELSRQHGIPALRRPFVNVTQSTRRAQPERDYAFLRAYYGEERWRAELTPSQKQLIGRELDASVVQRLGYALDST